MNLSRQLQVPASRAIRIHTSQHPPRPCSILQPRHFASGPSTSKPPPKKKKLPDKINYNPDSFTDRVDPEHAKYKRVTANDLATYTEPPARVKMLVRDFIEDSLYNPNYGYFPKQVNIFTATRPIDFRLMRNTAEFQEEVAKRYASYGLDEAGPGRQIWHTPTELFKVRVSFLRV